MYKKISQELHRLKNLKKIKVYQWFFKTGKGEYGEGDVSLGLTSAEVKSVAKKYWQAIEFGDIQKLLNSKIHEERMCALRILVYKYEKSSRDLSTPIRFAQDGKKKIYNFYIKNAKKINNWDLVDMSAPNIVGNYLISLPLQTSPSGRGRNSRDILYKLAVSRNLWEKRISIISTLTFIRNNRFEDTIKIAEILLDDGHDLINKAVGWMLREAGKKDLRVLVKFLDKYGTKMSRTTLRYAIEKFPEEMRQYYLRKK